MADSIRELAEMIERAGLGPASSVKVIAASGAAEVVEQLDAIEARADRGDG